jgi:predicted Zn-ribbon and HTH transcriptional regulator
MVKPVKEPEIGMVMLRGCRCRCGHEWLARDSEKPRVCPKCKSPNWDRPKKFERTVKSGKE